MKKMFRRWGFHQFNGTTPKWHKLQSRVVYKKQLEHREETHVKITAKCGYEFDYVAAIYGEKGPLEWRDEIKTKRLRCTKCDKIADDIEMV
jgi:hypothetical protein